MLLQQDRLIRYSEKGKQLSVDEHRALQWALVSIAPGRDLPHELKTEVFGLHTLGPPDGQWQLQLSLRGMCTSTSSPRISSASS